MGEPNRSLREQELRTEGDLDKNAKLWYEQVSPPLLGKFWDQYGADPNKAAVENMHRIMAIKGGKATAEEEQEIRRIKWEELCTVMEELEKLHGWGRVEGTMAYTKDEDPDHKSRVLGTRRSDEADDRRGVSDMGQVWSFRSMNPFCALHFVRG